MNCLSILLILFVSFNPEAQAEVLLSYSPHSFTSDKQAVAFDNEGNLWLGFQYQGDIIVSRIDQKGNPVLDKVLVRKWDRNSPTDWDIHLSNTVACDRWNNAYLMVSTAGGKDLHLVRITPQGQIADYFPWPKIDWENHLYLSILPSDTLLVIGDDVESDPYGRRPMRVAKAYLDSTGLTPISETDYDGREETVFSWFRRTRDFKAILVKWEQNKALVGHIYPEKTERPGLDPDILAISHLGLAPPYNHYEIYEYRWRDYVWRSYPDSWIGEMTFAPHKDGGYTLFFPDPLDRSTTYMLRLNEDGELLDPDDLRNGGERSVKAFGRLPSGVEPHAYFYLYERGDLDSARVSFWGCDDEGNLYNYSKLRKY